MTHYFLYLSKDNHAGYDWGQSGGNSDSPTPPTGEGHIPPSVMGAQQPPLSSRRELVELLDSEPLFDYLVQNGALEKDVAESILQECSPVKINLALIKHVEESGKNSQNLFLNALRVSGQHYLANTLDEGARIKVLTGSGFLSKSRHKGQVSMHVLVKAVKLKPDSFQPASPLTSQEWISLEDIQVRLASLTRPKPISLQPVEVTDPHEEKEESQCCLCTCFTRLFSAKPKGNTSVGFKGRSPRKEKGGRDRGSRPTSNQPVQMQIRTSSPIQYSASINNGSLYHTNTLNKENGDHPVPFNMADFSTLRTPKENRSSVQSLRNLANTVQEKSEVYYEVLRDSSFGLKDNVVKYFEQDRGVLILECQMSEGMTMTCICMKPEQVDSIKKDFGSGRLLADLEKNMVTDEVLDKIGATAVQLEVDINREDLEEAYQELSL